MWAQSSTLWGAQNKQQPHPPLPFPKGCGPAYIHLTGGIGEIGEGMGDGKTPGGTQELGGPSSVSWNEPRLSIVVRFLPSFVPFPSYWSSLTQHQQQLWRQWWQLQQPWQGGCRQPLQQQRQWQWRQQQQQLLQQQWQWQRCQQQQQQQQQQQKQQRQQWWQDNGSCCCFTETTIAPQNNGDEDQCDNDERGNDNKVGKHDDNELGD